MGAANCCKKPEEVLEGGTITTKGGNYENPNITKLDSEGFPHDSDNQVLKSQNVSGGVAATTGNAKQETKETNAKLYEQYFDAQKLGSSSGAAAAYEIPVSTANLGYDVQSGNVATAGYQANYQVVSRSPVAETAGYEATGANVQYEVTGGMNAATGYEVTASADAGTTGQVQQYDLQQVSSPVAQYDEQKGNIPEVTATSTKLASYDFKAAATGASQPAATDYQTLGVATAQQHSTNVLIRSPVSSSNYDVNNVLAVQTSAVPVQLQADMTGTQNEIAATGISGSAAYTTEVAGANLGYTTELQPANVGYTAELQQANLGYTTELPQSSAAYTTELAQGTAAYTTEVPQASAAYTTELAQGTAAYTTELPQAAAAYTTEVGGANLGYTTELQQANAGFTTTEAQVQNVDYGQYGTTEVAVPASGYSAEVPTSLQGTAQFGAFEANLQPLTANAEQNFVSMGYQQVGNTTDLGALGLGGAAAEVSGATTGVAGATSEFASFNFGGVQTSGVTTSLPVTSTTSAFTGPAIQTTNIASSYQIPVTTKTTTTRTVYQSSYAAPATASVTVGLPNPTFASAVLPQTYA